MLMSKDTWEKMDTTEPQIPSAEKRQPNRRKLYLIIVVAFLLVVCAVGIAYYLWSTQQEEVSLNANESVPSQIAALETDKVDSLANAEVDANADLSKAYAKAFALAQQGNYQAAAAEYGEIVATGKASHEVYVEYAAALYYGNDKAGSVRAMGTAIEKVKTDPKLQQADKDSILRVYNNQLKAYKDEASS